MLSGSLRVRSMATEIPKLQLAGAFNLVKNASPEQILEFILRGRPFYQELNIEAYTTGPLPGGGAAAAEMIALGKRYILATIECPDIRSLLQPIANGPAIFAYINTHLLGGRDEQAIIMETIENMMYDGNMSIAAFFGRFILFVNAIQPPPGHARKCMLYSARFPQSLLGFIASCDHYWPPASWPNWTTAFCSWPWPLDVLCGDLQDWADGWLSVNAIMYVQP